MNIPVLYIELRPQSAEKGRGGARTPPTPKRGNGGKGGLRDWSQITGRGEGLQNGRGAREDLPLRKRGVGGKSFSHAEGGTQSFEVVFMR